MEMLAENKEGNSRRETATFIKENLKRKAFFDRKFSMISPLSLQGKNSIFFREFPREGKCYIYKYIKMGFPPVGRIEKSGGLKHSPPHHFSHPTTMRNFKNKKQGRNKMACKKRSKNLEVARRLPPSYHTLPGEGFDIRKSDVINWLIKQPEILNYLWNNIKNSEDVEYNAATGVWTGVEYNGD